jgi:hypothetical protein
MIHKRWPLHPKPKGKQLLYDWIKDLANLYEVSYQYFCSKVLNLTNEEIYNFRSIAPEKTVLFLSNCTGISRDDLKGRDISSWYKEWEKEYGTRIEQEDSL